MADVLSEEGYRVETAFDGVEGVERVRELDPDLVLLDLLMPYMDGQTVLMKMRELGYTDVPVVVVSANYMNEAALAEQGAVATLAKPFLLTDLFDCVERNIRK